MSPSKRTSRRKRVRHSAVIAVLTASTLFGVSDAVLAQVAPDAQSGQTAAAQKQRFFMRIAAGNLEDALSRFTTQTGIRIVRAPGSLAGLQSPGVTGSLSAADALQALLAASGFTYRFTAVNAVALERPAAAAGGVTTLPPVEVEGQAPSTARDANPFADPEAPYKADRLSSSKYTEPILNMPRTVTVLTKEVLDDKNATRLKEIGRSTAGVTLGTGEGGNAFGDRFFIRGFDARNDVFVDGVRDPGVGIRENFDTEQVEILRGPGSTYAGRGTTGGAINIATKEAGAVDFYEAQQLTVGLTDGTKRATVDVNKVISPQFAVRLNGLVQDADVAGRKYVTDNRSGIAGAFTYKPSANLTIKGNYSSTDLWGTPDFGVPYDQSTHAPATQGVIPRDTFFGIVNRDFTRSTQAMGTLDASWKVSDLLTLENKVRNSNSLLNYIGTLAENPSATGATAPFSSTATFFSGFVQQNAQSRYESAKVLSDSPQAIYTFNTGGVEHTMVFGGEFSGEYISVDSYNGLTSELANGPAAFSSTGAPIVSIFNPTNFITGATVTPTLTGNPFRYQITTNAGYLMDTANIHNTVIINGGIRYDNYYVGSATNTQSVAATNGIVSYNGGIVVKPSKIASVYVAYATAADPVGDQVDATQAQFGALQPNLPASATAGPELTRSIEFGTKWELFDRHLFASVAAFQNNVSNAREMAPANLPGFVSGQVYANAAYRVRGVDLELAGNITNRWSLMGGLVFMSPKVTNSIVPTNDGLDLANIASQSFNLLTKYKLSKTFELGGQAIAQSQILGGSLFAANGGVAFPKPPNPTVLPGYWRFDSFIETDLGPHVELKLYVNNVFNKTYYDSIYQSAQPFIAIAPGRSVSLIGSIKL